MGREPLAEALVKRIRCLAAQDSPSFLVHIDGPWGSGKSTLFEFLKRRLEPGFLVVSINAWREQRLGVQWWTLLSALRRAVESATPWYRRPFVWSAGLVDQVRARWVPFVTALLVLAAGLVGLVRLSDLDLTASGKAADSILKILALASAAFAGVVAAARYLLPGSRKSAQGFVETNDNPMQEVRRLFARTLRRARRPVVFLVDDLDRCDVEYVVEFLEVVQTLVRDAPRLLSGSPGRLRLKKWSPNRRSDVAGPYAFIAADGQWVRSSYEKHYETFRQTAVPGRPLGYLFLEKVFQLHVRLPAMTPSAREAFLASLLLPRVPQAAVPEAQVDLIESTKKAVFEARSEGQVIEAVDRARGIVDARARMDVLGDAAVRFSERLIEEATEHALAPFSVYLEPDPRSIKLFVNTYGVLRSLRALQEITVPLVPLALWTIIEIRWPLLADHLRDHPEAIERYRTDGVDGIPDDVRLLLGKDDVSEVLENAKLLSEENKVTDVPGDSGPGPLSVDLIRQCSGSL